MRQTPAYEAKTPSKFGTATALFTILVAIFLIAFGTVYYLQAQATKEKLDDQVAKTNQLVEEVKVLTEENKENSQRAANYAYCNAYILAGYTQTLNPIQIEDLNACVVTVFPDGDGAPTIPQESFQQSVGNAQSQGKVTPQSSTGTSSGTTSTPAPTQTTPSSGGATGSGSTGGNNTTENTQSGIVLEPGKTLPLLNILPDVKIPGIIEIR